MTVSRELLGLKLDESVSAGLPVMTRRDVHLPTIKGKAWAVIGVRRSGKTSFLNQRRADRVAAGAAQHAQLLLSL
jgi:hypothetical protein